MVNWIAYWWLILGLILFLPIVGVVGFGIWMHGRKDANLENGSKCWDVFIKLVSALTAVAVGAMVFGKYIDQRDTSEQRTADFQKAEFLRKKLEFDSAKHDRKVMLLHEAARTAARIANSDTSKDLDITRFDELYFADLIGVEKQGGPVEAAMICFRAKQKRQRRPSRCKDTSLEDLVLDLSIAVQQELSASEQALIKQYENIVPLLANE